MTNVTPDQVTIAVQQIVMRLIGVMIEKDVLSHKDAHRILAEAALSLRQSPDENNKVAATYIDILTAQFSQKT